MLARVQCYCLIFTFGSVDSPRDLCREPAFQTEPSSKMKRSRGGFSSSQPPFAGAGNVYSAKRPRLENNRPSGFSQAGPSSAGSSSAASAGRAMFPIFAHSVAMAAANNSSAASSPFESKEASTLSASQRKALEFVRTGQSLLLTGCAG